MAEANNTLERRREEKAAERAEQALQDGIGRLSNLTVAGLELAQKQIAFSAAWMNFWVDASKGFLDGLDRVIDKTQKIADQEQKRA